MSILVKNILKVVVLSGSAASVSMPVVALPVVDSIPIVGGLVGGNLVGGLPVIRDLPLISGVLGDGLLGSDLPLVGGAISFGELSAVEMLLVDVLQVGAPVLGSLAGAGLGSVVPGVGALLGGGLPF